jgi:hypothetical protein
MKNFGQVEQLLNYNSLLNSNSLTNWLLNKKLII